MAKFNTPTTLNNGDESKYFKWLTKAEENQIFSQIDALPISQYEKNLRADTMYKEMLNKKKHTQFLNDRMEATNEINDRAASSKDPVESKTLKTQWKFWQLADMVRNLMYEKEWMNLDNFQDEDVVAAFLKDNPNMVDQFNSFMNWDISAESFSERNWFNYNAIDKAVDEVFWSANWTTASYINQQSEWEWNDNLFWRLDTETLDQWASVKWFLKNLAKSTWNVVADVWNMVANPFDTVNSLAKTAVGAWMNAFWLDDNTDEEWWLAEANQVADWLWDFLKERYWGKKEILNTLYSDPMWVVSDIASVVTWWSWIVKSVAWGIAKGAAKVWLANTARTAWNISKTAGRVMNFADKVDPYTQAMRTYAKWWEKVIEYWKKWAEYAKNNINLDSFVWLDSKTKKNIQDNPYSAEVWEKAQNYIEENGLPDKSQRVSKDLMQWVADEVQAEVNKLKQQLWETSPEYKKLKESGAKVSFYDINNKINEILENAGVQISPKWWLDFSKTAISPTEAWAIRRIYNWARTTDEMDIAEYMRYRKAIDQLNLWEDTKGTPWKNVIKEIREAWNTVAHEQVWTLAELDEQYSKMAKELDKVTEWIVYREKRKAGQLKDNFNQILKNLDEPNRRRLSQRLNELLPWVEEKVRAINMLPKLIDNYYRHDHVGDILKSFGVYWWVAWWFWWWIPWAIAWAVWWYFLGNAFNKLKKARWEKALSKLSEQGQERLAEITEKIQNKEELSAAEKNYIKAIWKNIEEWNFKENQVSSKTATKQDVFDWLVESIESITDEANQYTDADIKVMEQYLEESRKDLSENDYKNLKEFLNYQKNEYEIAKGEREFYESWEAQRIINWEYEKAVKDFQSRILKIENEEKNVGKVAGKKVNRAYAEQQQRNLEAKRERLIEEIWEYYWIDQFEAADKYDQLRDSANVNKVKYQVADESWKQYKQYKLDWKERADYEKLAKENKLYDREQTLDWLKYDIIQSKERWYDISEELFIQRKVAEDWIKRIQESIDTWKWYWVWWDNFVTDKAVLNKLMDEKKKIIDYIDNFDESTLKEYNWLGLSEEKISQQINSKEFKDFIWDSIAKNPDGTPKDLYHWTTDWWFTVFDINRSWRNANKLWPWIYLSNEPKVAREYTKHMNQETGKLYKEDYDTPEIMKVYARLENPLMIDKELIDLDAVKKVLKEWTKEYFFDNEIPFFLNWKIELTKDQIKALPKDKRVDLYVDYLSKWNDIQDVNKELLNQVSRAYRDNLEQWLQNLSKATWKDWVFFEKWWSEQYVLWDNSQVKSATDNIWTFDKNNPDIRFQKYWTAGQWERWVTAAEWLNIRNFKNWKSVQELADSYWIKTNIVDSISTPTGQKAYWMYWDRVITLAKDLKESTVPHELLHATFDMVDQWKKNQILDGIKERLKVDDVQAEEWLADNFSEYYRTWKFDTKAIPTTLSWKIKQFFQQIKEYIDWTYANRKEIQNLFDDIIDGKLEWEYWVYSDPKFQSVWHGSPYSFEKFDSTHMGEWEWAQAHGWGHYVAVDKDTWKRYAWLKKRMNNFTYKGKEWNQMIADGSWQDVPQLNDLVHEMQWYDISFDEAKQKRLDYLKNDIENMTEWLKDDSLKEMHNTYRRLIEKNKQGIKDLEKIKKSDFEWIDRNLYEIDIPDPVKKNTPTGRNYLDEWKIIRKWQVDKFLNVAKEKLKSDEYNKLKDYVDKWNINWWMITEDLYSALDNSLWWQKQASKFLESLGYDWIHYFWGQDWEAYVIFNDDSLKINSHEQY